jgi:probable addiction module antidote protein
MKPLQVVMPRIKPDQALFRDNPEAIADYLSEKFAENDLSEILDALRRVTLAQNVLALSRKHGLCRVSLYKRLRGGVDPQLGGILTLLNSFGVRISITPLPPRSEAGRNV